MQLTTLLALLQETAPASGGDNSTIRIVAGVLALVLVGVIIMRRKKSAAKEDDEF